MANRTTEDFAAHKARVAGSAKSSARADEISDEWVYVLLLLPLVAVALVAVMSSGSGIPPVALPLFVFANATFVLFDAAKLDTAGKALPVWQFIPGFVFPPFYLFFRARRLGRGFGYFWLSLGVLLLIVFAPMLYFTFAF